FASGQAARAWGSRPGTTSLEAILRRQMGPAVFPVPLVALSAQLTVQQVDRGGGEFTVGAFRVRAMRLRHPGTTLGFRLTPAAAGSGGGGGGGGRAWRVCVPSRWVRGGSPGRRAHVELGSRGSLPRTACSSAAALTRPRCQR